MRVPRSAGLILAILAGSCSTEIGDPGTPWAPGGSLDPGSGQNPGSGPDKPGNSNGPGASNTPGSGNDSAVPGANNGTGAPSATGADCTPNVPATSQIPRLTNVQYDRTVRDLLGVTGLAAAGNAPPSSRLATDQDGGLTDLAWANYKDVADKIATQVIADPTLKTNFMKCTPVAGDTQCFHDTIVEFGRRAFRRPLTAPEVTRFEKIVAEGASITETGAPDEIAQVLLYAFLLSPTFLQRAETTETADGAGRFALSHHEIASRLSFLLWGTTPDEALNQAADSGALSTPDQVAAQARRMLADPRAREMVNVFHQSYLVMREEGRWGKAQRDPKTFPSFKASIVPALTEETLKLFDKIAFTPGATFKDFFLTQTAYVNKDTAPLYGLDPSKFGEELTETTLDATRPGFLTRLGFLVNFSSYTRTNPIYRGAFITKDVLGIAVPAPPPGAGEAPLPEGADLDTNRKQVDAQTSGASCKTCHHNFINPPGFVMEAFDAIGAARIIEASGAELDTVASVTFDGATFETISTPAELMAKIATSPGAMRQYAKKWVGFSFTRENDPADTCTVERLAANMTASDYTVIDLITDITQTEPFRVRSVEVTQ